MTQPIGEKKTIPDFQIVENVKIVISVELDNRMIGLPELMRFEPGSILELRRPTGENVNIFAGKVLLGNGEILVVESNLAVRVADLFYRNGVRKEETPVLTKIPAH
jgi:flagellar motor switch/type III secretory pathway protein FliN